MPDLPPTNPSCHNRQFFTFDKVKVFRNGLVSATFELMDTTANGGGFCCVPGSHKNGLALPQEMRRVADMADPAAETWLEIVPARAGACINFTEALMHSTLPWKQLHSKRRTLFYKFSPVGTSHSNVHYDVREYEQYPDLTDRHRAILEPPGAGGRL